MVSFGSLAASPGEVILAFVTLLLVGVTALLVWVTWRLVTDGREHSKRQLRAYVSVAPEGINPYRGGKEQRFLGHVGVINNGQTPAKDIRHIVRLHWAAEGDWHPTINEPLTKTDIVLQPRAEMRIGSQPEPLSVIQAHGDEISYLYMWGRIEYKDEFSQRIRFTNFCHRYNATGGFVFGDRTIPPEDGRYHEHGNSAGP